MALKNGDIPLQFDEQSGVLQIAHYQHRFPICPLDYGWILAQSPEPALKALAEHFTALRESPIHWRTHCHCTPNWRAWWVKARTWSRH